MAHYAYKRVCYGIDYEKWKSLVKQFEEENSREHDGDGNYDGDNWYVAEMWIMELIAERDSLKKDAERYRWLRDNPWNEELTGIITYHRNALFDTAIDAELDHAIGKELEAK